MEDQIIKQIIAGTKANYKKIAVKFSDTREKIWPEMEEFKKYIKDGDKILDLGCGNGRLIEAFRNKRVEYTGMDNSKELIEIAKRKFQIPNSKFQTPKQNKFATGRVNSKLIPSEAEGSQTQNSKPKFVIGDITKKLPFKDNTFNLVFMIASFHHIPENNLRKQVLKEVRRVTKPHGLLIMTNWNLGQLRLIKRYKLWRLLFGLKYKNLDKRDIFVPWKLSNGEVVQRYYHAFTQRELKKLFEQTGWRVERQYKRKDNLISIGRKTSDR